VLRSPDDLLACGERLIRCAGACHH
jgi:hypothetical protein